MHTIGTADMVQLEAEENRWLARVDDVSVGYWYFSEQLFAPTVLMYEYSGCALRSVCDCSGKCPGKDMKSNEDLTF